jgi:hypothetical protein
VLKVKIFIYRCLELLRPFSCFRLNLVCGTCPVNVPGVENIDVSDLVAGHQDYCLITGEILKRVRHGQPFQADDANSLLGIDADDEMR